MSNPTYRQGPISCEIAGDLEKNRLVKIGAGGKIEHAGATGGVFGAITERGRLEAGAPGARMLAVHYGPAAVKLETTDTIAAGAAVFAGADGKAAGTGTVQVGVAVRATEGGLTLTVLNNCPTTGA